MDIFNNTTKVVKDDLLKTIKPGGRISIAAACFSIYAYQELREQLEACEELRFIFTSPTFVAEKTQKERREFYIPRLRREKSLYGTEFEVRLRNELKQRAVAKECVEWMRKKVQFRSNTTRDGMNNFMLVSDGDETYTYSPMNSFTTVDLGCERGNNITNMVTRFENPASAEFLRMFDSVWSDEEKLKDVTEEVIDMSNGQQRPPIRFHEGLNAILGDEKRSNSIGKSTLLMILDFVFGGKDYVKKCEDVQKNVGEHTINFTFRFDGKYYYFSRNTINYQQILRCDETYRPLGEDAVMKLEDYQDFLAKKYGVDKEEISWRGAMSKFIRVYKRETMDEERPLQSAKSEPKKDAIKQYMKQFERYGIVEAQINQAAAAEDERDTFKKSQDYGQVRAAKNKKEYDVNEKRATALEKEEQELAESSSKGLLDLDSVQAKRLSELNELLSNYRRQRAKVQTQLNAIRREMTEGKKSFKRTFSDLERFFPAEEFKALEDVEKFHQSLSKVLSEEFKETERDLATAYIMLGNQIAAIKEQITEVEKIPNVTQAILKEYARITTELHNVREANKNFLQLEELKRIAAEYVETKNRVIASELADIERTVNTKMREITTRILKNETQRSPELSLLKLENYTFQTPDDGGSGAQFRGVVTFDLANMELLNIPFVVHDSDLLDPIEQPALTEIIKEYDSVKARGQQAFVSFRSLGFYEEEAVPYITGNEVIELSAGGNELFGRAWNKEPLEDKG